MQRGDHVPDFTAVLDDGRRVGFWELLEAGAVVLFFYPKAFTPGCTAESCYFRDLAAEFEAVGAQRVGVSRDDVRTQARFRAEHGLDFPLISDVDGSISRLFGVKRPGPLPSKRHTFVVAADGTLRGIISSEMNMQIHAEQALEMLSTVTLPEMPEMIDLPETEEAQRDS